MRRIIVVGLLASLCACAATNPTIQDEQPVAKQYLPPTGAALVTVMRDRGFVGGGISLHLLLNGKLAAKLRIGQSVTVGVAPGDNLLEVRTPIPALQGAGDSVSIHANAGGRYYFRLSTGPIKLLQITEATALGRD
ncbi:MAG TPA: hypothetical protein VFX20_13905 [Steroidobacteraceae bacterium]|nr:hypothetical protein [Steroidobacteraceae bacterium]